MTRLSQEQLAAVRQVGPVRVVAGAGTGKTTVIVERFIRLVRQGADPAQILLMTFTERAAREMRLRIEQRLGPDAAPWVGTFHAVTQRWLREDGRRAGVPAGFRILTGPDRWILMWRLMWKLADDALVAIEHPEHQVGALLRTHERLKQELVPVPRLRAWAAAAQDSERSATMLAVARLFSAYERECRRQRRLDFDDLLLRSVRLLESDPGALSEYRARFPWVLVDEYQDTNLAQERIVELLAAESGQVFIVGDDDQSIYRFRGASRASLERFVASFPQQTTQHLTRNRRSSARIVRTAAALVAHHADRVPKVLRPTLPSGPRVEVRGFATGAAEAGGIAWEVRGLVAACADPGAIAVLTRTNAVAAPVAEALRAAGVPCRTAGTAGFFQQPAVKDLSAALRLVHDRGDPIAAERLMGGFGRLHAAGWRDLRDDLAGEARRLGVGDLFFELMERSAYLEGREDPEPALRFAQLVTEFSERESDQSLGNLLDYLALVELSGIEPEADAPAADADAGEHRVAVMTIHQAKGLEFDSVFVPSLVEGRLPQPSRRDRFMLPPAVLEPSVSGREDHLAEERRLFYVALTRARRQLCLSWAERYEGGERIWQRSRFLDELLTSAPGDTRELAVEAQEPPPAPAPERHPAPARREAAEPLAVSFSGLSSYRACPRQHWFRYVRRLPPAPSAEGFMGDAVHRALMAAARVRQKTGRIAATVMRRLLDDAWSERPFPDPRVEAVYRRLALNMTATYSQNGGFSGRVFHVEHPFETPLNGAVLRGVIDRIDEPREPGGPHVVVDYKTGAPLPASGLRRDFQLALYALGARRELGLGPLDLEIVYLREDKRVRLPADDPLLEEAEATAIEVVHRIERGEFPAHPELRRCRACAYRLACDSAV